MKTDDTFNIIGLVTLLNKVGATNVSYILSIPHQPIYTLGELECCDLIPGDPVLTITGAP